MSEESRGIGRGSSDTTLYGRTAERARIGSVVDGARASHSGALVVRGAAGVGKSTLLEECASQCADMRVLRARGVESESELAFAGLHQLLRPVLGLVERLPAHQAQALRAALGLEPGGSSDRFLVALAVLNVLAEAGDDKPVLCVFDDAHWADEASAAALLFAARRMAAERVALLFATRDEDAATTAFPAEGLQELRLAGLDRDSASALLTERAGEPVDSAVCDVLVAQTAGNPLALLELPTVLTADQLSGRTPLPTLLPLPASLARLYAQRADRLPSLASTALLVAAAEDGGRLATIAVAAAALGAPLEHLDAAERAGLVHIGEEELQFSHPLIRLAIHQSASAADRRAVHRALAAVLTEAGNADSAAWHLAAAATEPDETVARALEEAADRARARGGCEAACAALTRAAELTSEPIRRSRRTVAAAENAWVAGQFTRAAGLLDRAQPPASEPLLRATAAQLRGWLELSLGSVSVAQRVLLQAARDAATVDAGLARSILAAVAEAAWLSSDRHAGAQLRRATATLPAASGEYELQMDLVVRGFLCYLEGELAEALDLLTTSIGRAEQLGEPVLLIMAAHHALYVGDDDAAYRLNAALIAQARGLGAAADLQFALPRLVQAELLTGRWTAASANAGEAVALAEAMGQPALTAFPLAWLALLAALRGDDQTLWTRLDEIDRVSASHSLGIFQAPVEEIGRWARAVHSTAKGRYAAAVAGLETLTHPVITLRAAVDSIEAAVRAGRRKQAQRWLADLELFARHSRTAWAHAAAAHGHGLLSEGHVAESRFREALAYHERARRPFECARTELALGELLRRHRRRGDARAQLEAALQRFDDLGAEPWAERARVELRACGQTPRQRNPSTLRQLTPQEVQVARFVARGLSNRDIAAQLFLSPRTVDFHLRNVFAKLGISSRTQLARLTPSEIEPG